MDYSRFNIHSANNPYRNDTPPAIEDFTDKLPPREAHEEIHDLLEAMNDFFHTYANHYPEELSLRTTTAFEQACIKIAEAIEAEAKSMSLPPELQKALIVVSDAAGKMADYFQEKFSKYFPDDLDNYTPGHNKDK